MSTARFHFEKSFAVQGNPDKVFALLGPEEEKLWLTDWDADMVYPEPGSTVETDAVFISHPNTEQQALWVVDGHDKESRHIRLVRINHDVVVHLRIAVLADGQGSRITWDMTITALSEDKAAMIAEHQQDDFEELVRWLEKSMNHYLTTGAKLRKSFVHP